MIKSIVIRKYGISFWQSLSDAKIEFREVRRKQHINAEVFEILKDILPRHGFYLDVGAHDGRSSSNTYFLEKLGWTGILIEPIPMNFFKMKKIRSNKNKFVFAACVSKIYKQKYIEMVYADLMSFAPSISIVEKNSWVEGAKTFLSKNEEIIELMVPAKTLDSILVEQGAPRVIDFLSIDVEGSEMSVLDGLSINDYEIKTLCIETFDYQTLSSHLEKFGYSCVGIAGANYIFVNSRSI